MTKGGRPSKYNWEAIKEAYEGGLDKADIIKKYKVENKQLLNKINTENWVVNGSLKADITEFYENVHKTSQNIEKLHPENQDIMLEKINTLEQDNELILNNRKLAKMLQGVIVSNRNGIDLKNIKQVSSTLKDIESIANPRPEIAIQNNTQVNTQVNLDWSLIE